MGLEPEEHSPGILDLDELPSEGISNLLGL